MKKFIFFARISIEAENKDDARIEIIDLMDEHNIHWEIEEES